MKHTMIRRMQFKGYLKIKRIKMMKASMHVKPPCLHTLGVRCRTAFVPRRFRCGGLGSLVGLAMLKIDHRGLPSSMQCLPPFSPVT